MISPQSNLSCVIHAADYGAGYAGNFIASLRALGCECQRQGRRLVLVLPPSAREHAWCQDLMATGQSVYFVLPMSGGRSAKALASIVRRENAEILHCHFTAYDIAAWTAQKCLRLAGRRLEVIWHAHSEIPPATNFLRRFKNFIKYACLGRSTRMIAVSEHVRQQAVDAGCPPARIRAILNGIDVAWATTAARSKEQVARELAIPPDHDLLLLIGWNPPRKGVDLALAAVESLVAQRLPVVLGILGTQWLSTYLSERKVGASCPWVRQIAPTNDIASLYQAATVFLSPSRSEGFTYAACEAMANGTPVVLADIPPVTWARACPGAVFCRVGEADSLRDAIQSVLQWSAAERRERARESNRYIRENFDVRKWAEQLAAFYWGPPDVENPGESGPAEIKIPPHCS